IIDSLRFNSRMNPFALRFRSGTIPVYHGWYADWEWHVSAPGARRRIEEVFRDEGVNLQRDFVYRRDGIAFTADGYDPEQKIGYIFACQRNVEREAYEKTSAEVKVNTLGWRLSGHELEKEVEPNPRIAI